MRKFKKIYIEITNVCNLSCDFCPKTNRKKDFMSKDMFSHILDEIKPYTDYVYLHVMGEPLLHREIDDFLNISYEKGFQVNITTNGRLICQLKEKLFMNKALRQINLSLHSFTDINENRNLLKEIMDFAKEIAEKENVYISMRLWNLDEGNINLEDRRNKELLAIIEKEFNLSEKIEERLNRGRSVKLAEKVFLHQESKFDWPNLDEGEKSDEKGFCYGLRTQAAILVDGTVVPCCLDSNGVINLGNINELSFKDIIECDRAKRIYDGFSHRAVIEDLCKKCQYRKRIE